MGMTSIVKLGDAASSYRNPPILQCGLVFKEILQDDDSSIIQVGIPMALPYTPFPISRTGPGCNAPGIGETSQMPIYFIERLPDPSC